MNTKAYMIVGLVIRDTTAITALQTLHNIGLKDIKNLYRYDFYSFTIQEEAEAFESTKAKLATTDILANANKHKVIWTSQISAAALGTLVNKEPLDGTFAVFVQINNNEDGKGLLATLKNRLGFEQVTDVKQSVLWQLEINAKDQESAIKVGNLASELLLHNKHYQVYNIIR